MFLVSSNQCVVWLWIGPACLFLLNVSLCLCVPVTSVCVCLHLTKGFHSVFIVLPCVCPYLTKGFTLSLLFFLCVSLPNVELYSIFVEQHRKHHMWKEWGVFYRNILEFYKGLSHWLWLTQINSTTNIIAHQLVTMDVVFNDYRGCSF